MRLGLVGRQIIFDSNEFEVAGGIVSIALLRYDCETRGVLRSGAGEPVPCLVHTELSCSR